MLKRSSTNTPRFREVHVLPPSLVAKTIPPLPTPKQVLKLGQLIARTPLRLKMPVSRVVQVLPPSVVTCTVTFGGNGDPSAKQVAALGQLIPTRLRMGVCSVQVLSPLIVLRIGAALPTAKQVVLFGQL